MKPRKIPLNPPLPKGEVKASSPIDLKWNDIKRFLEIAPLLYPSFLNFIKKQIGKER